MSSSGYPTYTQGAGPMFPDFSDFNFRYSLNECHNPMPVFNARPVVPLPRRVSRYSQPIPGAPIDPYTGMSVSRVAHSPSGSQTSYHFSPSGTRRSVGFPTVYDAPQLTQRVAHLPIPPQLSCYPPANATQYATFPSATHPMDSHFPPQMYLPQDGMASYHHPASVAPPQQVYHNWGPSYSMASPNHPESVAQRQQVQRSYQYPNASYSRPSDFTPPPPPMGSQQGQPYQPWVPHSPPLRPACTIPRPTSREHITANPLAQQLSAPAVLPFPSQQGGAYNNPSPESWASTPTPPAFSTYFYPREGMDSHETSTNTTPELPRKHDDAGTCALVHGEVDQVLGKRQRVEDDEMPPKDSLSTADAIKEVLEWIACGTKIVEARSPGEEKQPVKKPVKKKAKTDESAPEDGKPKHKPHKRNEASCPFCSFGITRMDQMPRHILTCRAPRIVQFSTSGLSIQDLALAWKEGRITMSWDSKYQTLAECQRLERIIKTGVETGEWTWHARNLEARASERASETMAGNVISVPRNDKKSSKTRTAPESTPTSTRLPAGFQSQFQIQLAGPSGSQAMNDQPASTPQDLAVPEQVIFSLPWPSFSDSMQMESGNTAERRMGEGLNLIQPAVINCRQPKAKGKKSKAKRTKKVPASQAQQGAGPSTLPTVSASVAPPVIAGLGYDISSLMAPTSSHGPASSQKADDPIPSFDLFDDHSLGLGAVDAGGAPAAAASPDHDAEIEALFKMLLEENPPSPEYTSAVGVDSVQDIGIRAPAAPTFGDALASSLASQTVAMADVYMEVAPSIHSELSPILTPGEILAAAFAPKSDEGRDDFFF